MSTGFYRAFEDRHRGSREMILERLKVYRPYIQAAARLHPGAPFVDIGCGRGEWLELLQAEGIPGRGVDLDQGMLEACRARGLQAEHGDALTYLAAQPEASLAAVTGFHIAEHLSFADLEALITEAKRALKPGGLLILETPNPENLFVATSSFYLDPTHVRPLPPLLLSFLAEFRGFSPVRVLRLQESRDLSQRATAELLDVLGGASPDYAIVAASPSDGPGALSELPERELGLSSAALAMRFDQQQREDRRQLSELRDLGPQYDRFLADMRRRMDWVERLAQEAHEASLVSAEIAVRSQAELRAVYASSSWRLSAPVRWVGAIPRRYLPTFVRIAAKVSRLLGLRGVLRRAYYRMRGIDIDAPPPPPPPPAPAEPSATHRRLEERLARRNLPEPRD